MIYKYKRYSEQSFNGTSVDIKGNQEVTPKYLGKIGEWDFAYLPQEVEQDARIQATIAELTPIERDELAKQRFADVRKHGARHLIDKEVGDIYDLMADAMKLLEFNIMLSTRLAGQIYETNTIPPEILERYKARNKAFLDAVDAGQITLRSEFDDMDLIMMRIFARTSRINEIVRDQYINEMKEIGLR